MVVEVDVDNGGRKYVLAVVPGDKRVNLRAVANISGGRAARLAVRDMAMALTSCEIGAVPPFSFNEQLQVLADEGLAEGERIVFNAGRLDCSIIMQSNAYFSLQHAQCCSIAC